MYDKCADCKYSEDIGYDYDVYVCKLKSCIHDEDEKEQTSKSNKLIDEEKLDKLAKSESEVYGLTFADSSHHCQVNREAGFYDGFKAGYRKAKEE